MSAKSISNGTGACIGDCATSTAAYIYSLLPPMTSSSSSSTSSTSSTSSSGSTCDTTTQITYGVRGLRLLTASEYQNSLVDLLGITADYTAELVPDAQKGHFPNNSTANVDQNSVERWWSVGEKIAAWAVANNKPFACSTTTDCGTLFVDDFAPKLFRRPLTQTERDTYKKIFAANPGKESLLLALKGALNSPQFLYRSELGTSVSELLNPSASTEKTWVPIEPAITLSGSAIGAGTDGFRLVNLYSSVSFNYDATKFIFTGNDLIRLKVKGVDAGGWPAVALSIGTSGSDTNGNVLSAAQIKENTKFADSTGVQTLEFHVEGITGQHGIRFTNTSVAGHNENRRLYISEVSLSGSKLKVPSAENLAKLQKASPDAYLLNPYEIATFLSYALTGSTPDATLLAAAKSGALESEAQILAHINRLLETTRARKQMGEFAGFWFNTNRITSPNADRDLSQFPKFTPQVRSAMAEEVRELYRSVFFTPNTPFEQFYSGDFTMLNNILANYYGLPSSSSSPSQWVKADNLDKRGGILTTGAFMSVNAHIDKSSPIQRVVRLREQMLCQHLDPPPDNLGDDRKHQLEIADMENKAGTATTRRYYEVITAAASCDSCHKTIINPAFGMEDFDQVGMWRNTQKGSAPMNLTLNIDNHGVLYGVDDLHDNSSIEFYGAKDLSKKLAKTRAVQNCLITKNFRFLTGWAINSNESENKEFEKPLTSEQQKQFACVAEKSQAALLAPGNSAKAMVVNLMTQDLIRFRK